MPNLIDKPQLQATAQVAKSYILDQDTANVNTIINALQQSGGGEKTKGVITVDTSNYVITYNGDGTLRYMNYNPADNWSEPTTITSGATYPAKTAGLYIFAEETDNYSAAVFVSEPD